MKKLNITEFLRKTMLYIMLSIVFLALTLGTLAKESNFLAFICAIILLFLLIKIFPFFTKLTNKLGAKKCYIILTVICLVIKLLWVIFIQIEPTSDYKVFYDLAIDLSNSFNVTNKYVAAFPHYFGYSTFLSIIFSVLSNNYLIVPIINVIFSVITGLLIYKIAYKFLGLNAACYVFIFWIICPSQTMYNSLVLSEPFYTFLIVLLLWMIIKIFEKIKSNNHIKRYILYGITVALILQTINICRPISLILIIALFIWIFILNIKELKVSNYRKNVIIFYIIMIGVYLLTGIGWNKYMEARLGTEPAEIPGFTIFVGLNQWSGGSWNIEDSTTFGEYLGDNNLTANEAQHKMFEKALDRAFSGNISYFELFKSKITNFIGGDDGAVWYLTPVLKWPSYIAGICNIFYYLLLVLSLMGIKNIIKYKERKEILLFPLYIIGLTLAHMIVEVALRYHYSIIPILIVISSYAFINYSNNIKDKTNKCEEK